MHDADSELFIGLLATAIIKMDGVAGLAGWRWIFILEGIATVVISLISTLFLPADIQSAKFLTDTEREFARKWLRPLAFPGLLFSHRHLVRRLRTSHGVTTSAPLSEPSQRITAGAKSDPEKSEDTRVETHPADTIVVETEDEKFEWGEVIRGMWNGCTCRMHVHVCVSGVKDPQVWMTAFSYMGIIVSLYSFSLFLYVAAPFSCQIPLLTSWVGLRLFPA